MELIQIMRNTYYPENYVREIDVTIYGVFSSVYYHYLSYYVVYPYNSNGVYARETLGNKVSFA